MLVGFLGEQGQSSWWTSSFLARTSEAFLSPIFGSATFNARLVGVTEAARRVHDDAIGVGRAFHLFRLPETVEQELHRTINEAPDLELPASADEALEGLRALSVIEVETRSGPVHIGPLLRLSEKDWISPVAAHYRAAFLDGGKRYPYFAG